MQGEMVESGIMAVDFHTSGSAIDPSNSRRLMRIQLAPLAN